MSADNDIEVVTSRMLLTMAKKAGQAIIGGGSLWLMDGLDTVTEDGAVAIPSVLVAANAAEWHKITGYLPITAGTPRLYAEELVRNNPNYGNRL